MARKIGLIFGGLLVGGGALWIATGGLNQAGVPKGAPEARLSTGVISPAPGALQSSGQGGQVISSPASLDERITSARTRWESVAAGVRKLDSSDQTSLDGLYSRARETIRKDEEAWLEAISQSMGTVIGASFEESFFTVSAWIRSSQTPARILDAIWKYQPPADTEPSDPHHPAMTQAVRYERVQAYGVRELRQQLGQGGAQLSPSESQRLISELLPRATREPSLDLSIEMFQLLVALKAPDQAIQTALQGHSERDRELLQGILNAH